MVETEIDLTEEKTSYNILNEGGIFVYNTHRAIIVEAIIDTSLGIITSQFE